MCHIYFSVMFVKYISSGAFVEQVYIHIIFAHRMKDERDTAMQNVGELESMLTECQRKAKDRIRKVRSSIEIYVSIQQL